MKFFKSLLLCLAVAVVSSCSKDDDEDVTPEEDKTHQMHTDDGYSIIFPTGKFRQYHHNMNGGVLDWNQVIWNSQANVFCLKSDSTSNISIVSTTSAVTSDGFAEHNEIEIAAFESEYNYNQSAVVDSVLFPKFNQYVKFYSFAVEGDRELQIYYMQSPVNGRGYRFSVQAPTANSEFWGYLPEVISLFNFVEE